MADVEKIMLKDHPEMYTHELNRLTLCVDLLSSIDLEGIAALAERAHTTGPIQNPTMYRGAMALINPTAELARAAAKAVKALEDLRRVAEQNRPAAEMTRKILGGG